jgi:hypothetical protein
VASVPAVMVVGPLLLMLRSAEVATVLLTVEVLSALVGSLVLLVTLAVLLMVELLASLERAWTTRVKVALAPEAKLAMLPLTVPVPPGDGLLKVKPEPLVWDSETKVVPLGMASVRLTFWASEGPALVRVMV